MDKYGYLFLKALSNPLKMLQVLKGEYIISPKRFVKELMFGVDGNQYFKEIQQDKSFQADVWGKYERVLTQLDKEKFETGGGITEEQGQILYVLARMIRPINVVETGTANGISTAYILRALDKNQKGKLYSIDFPNPLDAVVPKGKEPGWIAPKNLKYRWKFIEGKSKEKLEPLLKELKVIEIFFHDSDHSYENMLFEFNTVWPYLRSYSGVLLSHDVGLNFAFSEFCKKVGIKGVKLREGFGGIRK